MKQIPREDVSIELLVSLIENSGYRCQANEEFIDVISTPFATRVRFSKDYPTLKILCFLKLKSDIDLSDAYELEGKIHRSVSMVQAVCQGWEDGTSSLVLEYQFYFPFGLNMANFMYCLRMVGDLASIVFRDHGKNPKYFSTNDAEDAGDESSQSGESVEGGNFAIH